MGALTDICLSTYVGNSWCKYLGKCWAKTRIQPHVVFTKGILPVTMEPNERKVRKLLTCVWQFGFLENRKLTSKVKLCHFLAPTMKWFPKIYLILYPSLPSLYQNGIWWRWKPETNRNVVFLKEIYRYYILPLETWQPKLP